MAQIGYPSSYAVRVRVRVRSRACTNAMVAVAAEWMLSNEMKAPHRT